MRVSQVIQYFEDFKKKHGDVELVCIDDDGRSSSTVPYEPSIRYTTHWNKTKGYFVNS